MPMSKEWHRAYSKSHYERNTEKYREANRRSMERRLQWYRGIMTGKKCKRCGEDSIEVLEWHHFDPSNKVERISVMVKDLRPTDVILKEMKKCWVLCKNCHCKEHYGVEPGEGMRHDPVRRRKLRRLKYLRTGT